MLYTPIKKIIGLLVAVALVISFSGCASKNNYRSSEISKEIQNIATFSEMKELSGTSLPTYFVFQDGNVKRYSVMVSATGESADTLACFEVNDKEQRATVISGISQYLTNLSTSFKSTMGQEYDKVEKRLLVEFESIIVLVICSDTTAVWEYLTKLGAKEVI